MELGTTEAELRELVGEPVPSAVVEERDRLHDLERAWLAASPSCLLATAGADGTCDAFPRGDPPGVVHHCPEVGPRPGLGDAETWDPGTVPDRARIARALEHREQSWEVQRHQGAGRSQDLYE